MRAERRNISISNEEVSKYLDRQQNVSKFIETLVIEHIEKEKVEYAKELDLEELREDFKILNRNYLEVREILNEVVQSFIK